MFVSAPGADLVRIGAEAVAGVDAVKMVPQLRQHSVHARKRGVHMQPAPHEHVLASALQS